MRAAVLLYRLVAAEAERTVQNGARRPGFENRAKELRDSFFIVGSWPTGPCFAVEANQALLEPLPAPEADGRITHRQPPRNRDIRLPSRRRSADGEQDCAAPSANG